jgi:nucleoside-diphosphate-sugar epimerase
VTGEAGFLGSFVVEALQRRGAAPLVVLRSAAYDLRQPKERSDLVIHRPGEFAAMGCGP